ncbi:MAG: hypothetical protein K9W43_13280 [Candidatus Thorarchaeota archaeon]|nr:hypothetical protein [Candidatus Thorarchaeota archaeon]
MTIIEKLEHAVSKVQSIFDSHLSRPCRDVSDQKYRPYLIAVSEALQDLYNLIDTALGLLRGYHEENKRFLANLEYELLGRIWVNQGSRADFKPFVKTSGYTMYGHYWEFKQIYKTVGGILVAMEFLRRSMGFDHDSKIYAVHIRSAYQAFQQTVGSIKKLQSRLKYTVMYPDSISKDALQIRTNLRKLGLDEIWQQFSVGLDNFHSGDLIGSTNRLTNTLTSLIRATALKYGYQGGQLGAHTIFLEKIGFIHDYVKQMISNYYGYLSKFSKGVEPSINEARFLLDFAFSLFGFLILRMDNFSVLEETAKVAKKETKDLVKSRK